MFLTKPYLKQQTNVSSRSEKRNSDVHTSEEGE